MFLFHYTDKKEFISREGLVRDYISETTEAINEAILEHMDYLPVDRDYCVYLSFNKRDDLECTCKIDLSNLNQDALYVANEEYADAIYDAYICGRKYGDFVAKYCGSIVSFSDYIQKNLSYEKPELLYMEDIPPKDIEFIQNY